MRPLGLSPLTRSPAARVVVWGCVASFAGCGWLQEVDDAPVDTAPAVEDTPEPEDPCPYIPEAGKCDDNTLVVCGPRGEPKRTDCGLATCALGEDGLYACIEPQIDGNPSTSDVADNVTLDQGTIRSDRNGLVTFSFDVTRDDTAFLVTALPREPVYAWLVSLVGPDGDERNLDNPMVTGAIAAGPDVVFAWPPREVDGPLERGTWYATLQLANESFYAAPGVDVDVSILTKQDPDLDQGQVRVALIWTGTSSPDANLASGVSLAVQSWRDIYARSGIELVVDQYTAANIPAVLPLVADGDDAYITLAEATDDTDIVVTLVEDFQRGTDPGILGQSGGIPGTTMVGPRASISVSWARHAGVDGRFNSDEVSFLSTTLAHEVGHYVGLFHPVETDWASFDPLADTAQCTSETSCINRLGSNLMFPYNLCYGEGCEANVDLTANQTGVMQLYPGTL